MKSKLTVMLVLPPSLIGMMGLPPPAILISLLFGCKLQTWPSSPVPTKTRSTCGMPLLVLPTTFEGMPHNKASYCAATSSGVPSPTRLWASTSPVHTQSPRPDQQYAIGEQILVLTDDGKAWMDGLVVACYSRDCEAEGYSIPGGTVKVSYDLGIKWIMPQNITTTLRKKTPTSFPGFGVPPRHGITNVPQTQQPYSKQEVQQSPVSPAVTRHVFHGGMPMLLGRGA
mmetsp:Transcript_54924/g.141629  ORF Transcript_54924/g.141629 Transcript_54924/m.141629 type:complete len:227 (-) Transcript_54924:194-874(-)